MTAAASGDGTAAVELDGRRADVDDDDGWTEIVAAVLEQRTANRSAWHMAAHSDAPRSTCNVMQVKLKGKRYRFLQSTYQGRRR